MKLRLLCPVVFALLFAACGNPASPTSPSAMRSTGAVYSVAEGVSCPSDAPTNLRVSQQDGRTDIEWNAVGSLDIYLVWLEVETATGYVSLPGAPATATERLNAGFIYPVYLPEGTYAVRVQSRCGDHLGNLTEPVVFGGHSGPIVIPPTPEPPACAEHKHRRHHHHNGMVAEEPPSPPCYQS